MFLFFLFTTYQTAGTECARQTQINTPHTTSQTNGWRHIHMSSSEYIVATALKPRKKIIGERIEELVQRRSRIESYGNAVFTLMLLRGSDAYTSKQCGMCGALHESLRGSKVFCSPKCSSRSDRDVLARSVQSIMSRPYCTRSLYLLQSCRHWSSSRGLLQSRLLGLA